MDEYTRPNLQNWNERTAIHARSEFYDVAGFKAGKSTLKSIERQEVGDVSGKSLLHLQCHFGLDTLSWARLGADVTGVDFSDKAIELAKSLSSETGLNARFICSEIFRLSEVLNEQFDVVYASYGVLCWVSDLRRWMQVAAAFLKSGGIFYIIDGHPVAGLFGNDLRIKSYFHDHEPKRCEPEIDYAEREALLSTPCYRWKYSVGDIINAAVQAGLAIEFVHEFPFVDWELFPGLMQQQGEWYVMKDTAIQIPMMFSLKATKNP